VRWPWRKEDELRGEATDEATHAAQEARRALRDAQHLACRAEDVAHELSRTRERNGFAAAVKAAIRGA
jgi:hypothetical protein